MPKMTVVVILSWLLFTMLNCGCAQEVPATDPPEPKPSHFETPREMPDYHVEDLADIDTSRVINVVTFCAPDLTEQERIPTEVIWSLVYDCTHPMINIFVEEIVDEDDNGFITIGESRGNTIIISPLAWSLPKLDVPLIVAHEVGHYLGHGHACSYNDPCEAEDYCNVMFPTDAWNAVCIREKWNLSSEIANQTSER